MTTSYRCTLRRWGYHPLGTYGHFELPDCAPWPTVEPPWRSNAPNVSCIPTGTYELRETHFHDAPAIEVRDVPGRFGVLGHAPNWPDELAGCFAPGCYWMSRPNAQTANFAGIGVRDSRTALNAILAALATPWRDSTPVLLTVTGEPPL